MLLNRSALLIILHFIWKVKTCPSGWQPSLSDANVCFSVAQAKMSWTDAKNYCQNIAPNANLVSILSAFDTNVLNAISSNSAIGSLDQVWIGARGVGEDERFEWVDGKPFIYTNWLAGQPNLLYPCVSTLARSTGRWRTEPCETKNYFVCKYMMTTANLPTDCYDWKNVNGNNNSGVHRLYPPGIDPFDALCDMTTDGGGWTIFQKRVDNSLIFFNQSWQAYKKGFDNGLSVNHWLGLDRIHVLSSKDEHVDLRIELNGDRCHYYDKYRYCSNQTDGYWYGTWDFKVNNESDSYRLKISWAKSGNLSDYDKTDEFYHYNNGGTFDTFDHDSTLSHCAQINTGYLGDKISGWGGNWYNTCTSQALNGYYIYDINSFNISTIYWARTYNGIYYSIIPITTEMKLRRY